MASQHDYDQMMKLQQLMAGRQYDPYRDAYISDYGNSLMGNRPQVAEAEQKKPPEKAKHLNQKLLLIKGA